MKLSVVLTVSQAIAIQAFPLFNLKRADTCGAVTVTQTVTYTESIATRRYTGILELIYSEFAPAALLAGPATTTATTSTTSSYTITTGTIKTTSTAVSTHTSTSSVASAVSTKTSTSSHSSSISSSATGGIFLQSVTTTNVQQSVSVSTTTVSSGIVQILPTTNTKTPGTTGSIQTSLQTVVTSNPLISTIIPSPTALISVSSATSVPSLSVSIMTSANIFQPVATSAPPTVIGSRSDHPVARLGIVSQSTPKSTNKFYANFFLGTQTAPAFTHPYSLAWAKGAGSSASWGLSISQIDASQRVFGATDSSGAASYFINPNGIQSIVMSALGLSTNTTLSSDSLTAFSMNLSLLPAPGASPAVTFPLVQGMAFVTGIYNGTTPVMNTGVFFRTVTLMASPKANVTKYGIVLEDGKQWFLYATSVTGAAIKFTVVSNSVLQATSGLNGYVQIAKAETSGSEALYDKACGVFATTASVSGSASGAVGSYSLSFTRAGISNGSLAMFALPHHIESFAPATAAGVVSTVQMNTTTKGIATAVVADSWTLLEPNMPTTMGFAPWSPTLGSQSVLSAKAVAAIKTVAESEISQDISSQTDLDSFYYSGKALAKFAQIVYTLNDLLNDTATAQAGLTKLKSAFSLFANNTNQYPLVYESAWGGIVSTASYVTGDSGVDFGNTYYNDHHFHYSYFVYAAAMIGHLDPTWLKANKDYVNTMVRDYANPSTADNYFPVSRSFDWYHGHSWAKGLFESFDGKDEESSSEDTLSAYAIKMWGKTTGDANMEARGNLQLAITARSLQHYFLYQSNNTVEPSNFIANKVSGILFENKIDHTTYFGTNIEYIQGIHMIPLLPSSTLTRKQAFVTEEWNTYFSDGRAATVTGGWKGILYANLAIIDPVTSYNFFANSTFDVSWLDGGASRTWYMALAAGLGGAS